MFGEEEILVAATKLTDAAGIHERDSDAPVEYFHILFDRHEIIFANGAACESLYLGEHSIKAMTAEAREEIQSIFPELGATAMHKAREFEENRKKLAKLVHRHSKNRAHLVDLSLKAAENSKFPMALSA